MGRPRLNGFGRGKLTLFELRALQMLADGYMPKQLTGHGQSYRAIQQMMYRMRIKLGATTTPQMTALAVKKGFIK